MKVSAIVVTFNRVGMLKKCLKHLMEQSYNLNNIIVINNDSTDSTKEYLHNLNSNKIIVKNMSKNVGGAGGFNMGVKLAFEDTNSDFFWLMDDDAMPSSTSLEKLVIGAKKLHYHFGFLCSNVRWWKDKSAFAAPRVDHNWSELLPSQLVKVRIAPFLSYMFSRKAVSKIGLPVRQMFIWGDDVDYSLRLHNYLPCYFVSDSIVIHNTESSPYNSMFNMAPSRDKYLKCGFRNELYAYRKNSNLKGLLKQVLVELFFIIRIPFLSKRDRIHKLWCAIAGFFEGFFFNPKVEFPNDTDK